MHKKLLTIFCFLLLVVFFTSVVNAQNITSTTSADRLKMQLQEIQEQKKTSVSEIKQEANTKIVELRDQIKEAVRIKREAEKEAIATKRREFKVKLQAIKNEKKRALVDRIDAKIIAVNTKRTDRFTQVLNNLQILLDKITGDIDKTDAQAAIEAAKVAVVNQAAKSYTIALSTETALRSNVGAITSQLRLDLMATHKLVIDAKQAVQTLRKDNAIMKKEATNSANL